MAEVDFNGTHSHETISFNNGGTSFNNTAIDFGRPIKEIKKQYFIPIPDEASHKRIAEWSLRKYQNLRMHGTCEWLLEEPSYQAWAACKGRYVRISGRMGCGKSTLVARAVEHVQERETPSSGHRVLYFFASSLGGVSGLRDLQPTLKTVLLTFWDQLGVDEDGGIGGATTKNLGEAELVDGIIWKLKESKTTHISVLIDAFDALSPSDRGKLHSMLLNECKKGKDKIQVSLLTSHTRASTSPAANGEIHITTNKNGEDMKKFLRARLSNRMLQQDEAKKNSQKEEKDAARKELTTEEKAEAGRTLTEEKNDVAAKSREKLLHQDEAGKGFTKEEKGKARDEEKEKAWTALTEREKGEVQEIVKKIMNQTEEMFLWAAVMVDLVCRAHDKKERERMFEGALKPKHIQAGYEKLVEWWEGKTARGRLEQRQRNLARRATGLLTHKQGLLSCAALTEVLDEELREAAAQKRVADEVMECCRPFIEYDKDLGIFRFAHPSMHEFFVNREASRTSFADQTLAYLCRPAFRRGPFAGAEWWEMGELRPFLESHPFLGFAAANWADAVHSSKGANRQNRNSTRNLLAKLYNSEKNLLLAFQVWCIAAQSTFPAQLRSAHVFSFFGLFDNLSSSRSPLTTVQDAAMADSNGNNAIQWALRGNDQNTHLQTVRVLMRANKAADMVSAQGSSDLTPLHHAAHQGDLAIVRLLLSGDPDKRALNAYSKQYGTPLTMAATYGRVDVVEELIKAGADLDVKCNLGNMLHAAAQAPDKAAHACVEAILRNHPCPRRLDVDCSQDGTPLHVAAYHGHQSVVKLLLEKGFSARKRSWTHRSTITAAAAGCHRGTDPEPFIRIMEMLHDAGAKAHAAGANGHFALHHAAQFNQPTIARLLHNCGANCFQKSPLGTPLQVAVGLGHMEVVRVLLMPREKRQRAYMRKKSERQKRRAEISRKRKKENSTSREESILCSVILTAWEPVWHSAVAANDMARIYRLVDQYEHACDAAIQQKASRHVKGLAHLGTAVFTSVISLIERPREPQQNQQKSTNLRRKARQVLSSTTKGALKLYGFCDTTLSYFQLKVHNGRPTVGTEFHPGTYEEILDRLTLAAVRILSKAFEQENFDAVPPLAEASIDGLLAIKSVSLREKLVEKRAQALKVILTDATKPPAEKQRDAGILAKVGIELLAVALRQCDNDAASLARSLAKLWATALHDADADAADVTRIEDIFHVCNAFLEVFQRACEPSSSSSSSARSERVRLLARVGAEVVLEAVKTDNETLINNMRRIMDASRNAAATAGLKDEVEEVLMEKHGRLEAGRTAAPVHGKRMNRGIAITGGITDDRGSGDHGDSEGSEGDVPRDEGNESKGGTGEEVESRRLRIALQILRGHE